MRRVFDHELTKSTLYHWLIILLVSKFLLYHAVENTANKIQSTLYTAVSWKQKRKSVRDTVERRLLWVTVANGSLIEAKGNSLWQKETAQTGVFMFFLPWTVLTSIKEHQTITTHNNNSYCRVRFYDCARQLLSDQLYLAVMHPNFPSCAAHRSHWHMVWNSYALKKTLSCIQCSIPLVTCVCLVFTLA